MPDIEDYKDELRNAFDRQVQELRVGLLEEIAQKTRSQTEQRPIVQTVYMASRAGALASEGLHRMQDESELASHALLFAPISDGALERVLSDQHAYVDDGRSIPVRVEKFDGFVEQERCFVDQYGISGGVEFVKWARLPLLNFPFLPYSRKFLKLVFAEGATAISGLQPNNLRLNGTSPLAEFGLVENYVPLWSVKSHQWKRAGPLTEDQNLGGFSWAPETDKFGAAKNRDEKKYVDPYRSLLIHEAVSPHGDVVPIDFIGGRFVSNRRFEKICFSEICPYSGRLDEQRFPVVGHEEADVVNNHWYRSFVQTLSFTKRDIAILLGFLPSTRGKFICRAIEREPVEKNLPFNDDRFHNYLWYLYQTPDSEQSSTGAGSLRWRVVIHFSPIDPSAEAEFLTEERAKYFASLCRAFLPFDTSCRAELG